MADPIRFYLDFASPYAYFAAAQVEEIGREFGRAVEWRPILMWAVLKAQGIAAPMDAPAKRDYMLADMERSAAFFGLPYRKPAKLPFSSHLAGRLFHSVHASDPEQAVRLAKRILPAVFAEGRDIADETVLASVAEEAGIHGEQALEAMKGPAGRAGLEGAVAEAVSAGVIGSPHFIVDEEGLFGADRLPQLRWLLSGGRA